MSHNLLQIRSAFPEYRFFEDDRYGFCILVPHTDIKKIPHSLLRSADSILGISSEVVAPLKDRKSVLWRTGEHIRLFRVIVGLVPSYEFDADALEQLRIFKKASPDLTVPTTWARLGSGPKFDF